MQQTPGQIYLADQRGVSENETFTRWCTFNYNNYFHADRQGFGALLTLNDELFNPLCAVTYQPMQPVWVVIIPITGEVAYRKDGGNHLQIDVGQVLVNYVPAGDAFDLSNPYNDDRINFLHLEFKADGLDGNSGIAQLYDFDVISHKNQLIRINAPEASSVSSLPFNMHIGQFSGRHEALYTLQNSHSLFFAFAISGAFELQGRLLHQRDGLALWDLQEADMEALSNGAVVLVLEMIA